eukprot:PhF_6_TR16983/c1_g1_i3/m.25685
MTSFLPKHVSSEPILLDRIVRIPVTPGSAQSNSRTPRRPNTNHSYIRHHHHTTSSQEMKPTASAQNKIHEQVPAVGDDSLITSVEEEKHIIHWKFLPRHKHMPTVMVRQSTPATPMRTNYVMGSMMNAGGSSSSNNVNSSTAPPVSVTVAPPPPPSPVSFSYNPHFATLVVPPPPTDEANPTPPGSHRGHSELNRNRSPPVQYAPPPWLKPSRANNNTTSSKPKTNKMDRGSLFEVMESPRGSDAGGGGGGGGHRFSYKPPTIST